jgi:hypothetical protein
MIAQGTGYRVQGEREENKRTIERETRNEVQITIFNQNGKGKKRDCCPVRRTLTSN